MTMTPICYRLSDNGTHVIPEYETEIDTTTKYNLDQLPAWARAKLTADLVAVQLTGTIWAAKDGPILYLWSTTGHIITPNTL